MLHLMFIFAMVHARPESSILSKPADLVKLGWELSVKDGLTTATYESHKWKRVISSKDHFEVSHFNLGETAHNWDYTESTTDGQKIISNTHCYPVNKYEDHGKPKCKTVNAAYCSSILKLSDSAILSSDISKLTECSRILEKVDFDMTGVEAAHKTGMDKIYQYMDKKPEDFVHSIGKPRKLWDVVMDYHACQSYEGRWFEPGKTNPAQKEAVTKQ